MKTDHKTPLDSIRAYCVECNGGNDAEVRRCDGDGKTPGFPACLFHRFRMGKGRPSVKIIRKFCLDCMGDNRSLVSTCETTDCLCHPFRMGKNPARQGKGGGDTARMALIRPVNRPVKLRKPSVSPLKPAIPSKAEPYAGLERKLFLGH